MVLNENLNQVSFNYVRPKDCKMDQVVQDKETDKQFNIKDLKEWLLDNTTKNGLVFTYIRPEDTECSISPYNSCNGATVCFKLPEIKGNIIECSIVWCNSGDPFNKVIGRYLSAVDYLSGKRTKIRLPYPGDYSIQLREMFQQSLL